MVIELSAMVVPPVAARAGLVESFDAVGRILRPSGSAYSSSSVGSSSEVAAVFDSGVPPSCP